MTEDWTILPEFDGGHQNRYIVMLSDRAVADNVAKKFPKICSEPFELKNDKYSWGLYVDNSTRDERKNIYKFFLGETEGEQELKKEEEIKEVISELNDIFSTLTKDEQRHIEEEIPAKIENIEKFAEKKSEEKTPPSVADIISAENIPVVKKDEPRSDAAIVPPAVVTSAPPLVKSEKEPEISPSSVPAEKRQEATGEDIKIEIERFGAPASSSVSSLAEKKEASAALTPDFRDTAVPSQPSQPVPAAAAELSSREPVPVAAVSPPVASSGLSAESIKVGYLYPAASPEALEKFIGQLKTVTEKSMKMPIYLEKVSETGYNTTGPNDFNSIIAAAKLKKADIILAVIPDSIDDIRLFIDTACRRNEILYMVAQQSQLDKKFLFVDMAIELLLIKKKLRS